MSTIKESSDEFNASEALPAGTINPRKTRTLSDYLALAIGTCGVGYFPIAPGTLGSIVGVGLYALVFTLSHHLLFAHVLHNEAAERMVSIVEPALIMISIFIVTMAGIWAGTRVERLIKRKDPSIVVVDEVAGQMIALCSAPLWLHTWWSILSAFLLFRLFDIWKPYPIRRLEELESGLGIMADDLGAGMYALIVNTIIISTYVLVS